MTEKQIELLNDYFNEGMHGDYEHIKNLDKNYFLVYDCNDKQHFMDFLKEIGTTWEEFKKEYEIEDWDYRENYFVCSECGKVFYMNEYGVNQGYVRTYDDYLVCNDCADWKDIIEDFTNDAGNCIDTDYNLDNELIECGFYKYDTYNFNMCRLITPKTVIKEFENDYDYVWVLTHKEVFGVSAELWLKKKEN